MTEQTQPTDAELEACPFCGNANAIVYDDLLTFHAGCLSCGSTGSVSSYRNGAIAAWNRRAVLAKWGTPAGAGEPYGYVYTAQVAPIVGDERKVERTVFTRNKPPCNAFALYTTPQPTQPQAGAVPLTDEQIEEIAKQFITRVGSHWEHDDAIPDNGRIEDFVRAIEHAHGIKGADHG